MGLANGVQYMMGLDSVFPKCVSYITDLILTSMSKPGNFIDVIVRTKWKKVFKIIFILKQSQMYRKVASVVYQSVFYSIYNNTYIYTLKM